MARILITGALSRVIPEKALERADEMGTHKAHPES